MNEIDTRVVEMQFENGKFERDIANTIKSLAELDKSLDFKNAAEGFNAITNAANNVSLQGILDGVEWVQSRFGVLGTFIYRELDKIVDRVVGAGQRIVNGFTLEPITEGFEEYNLKTKSTQTILNNVKRFGNDMGDVSRALDILNEYADKTTYSFAGMVQTMSGASNAGLNIDELTTYAMGISNLAAYTGADNTTLQRVGYQINQALNKGYFDLTDWRSIEISPMGNNEFQEVLKQTARENGIDVDTMIANSEGGAFRSSLTEYKWLTKDIFLNALSKYADSSTELGNSAFEAATKSKTLQESLDQIKESLGSGWTKTFELFVGNVEQAKVFWTTITNGITSITDSLSDSRNEMLEILMDTMGGREVVLDILESIITHVKDFTTAIGLGINDIFGDLREFAPAILNFLQNIRAALKPKEKDENGMSAEMYTIARIARGAAAALKIFLNVVKGLGIIIKPVLKILGSLALKLFDVAAAVGDFVTGISRATGPSDAFIIACTAIANVIDSIPGKLTEFKDAVVNTWETIRAIVKDNTGFDIDQPFIDAWNAVSDFSKKLSESFADGSIWTKLQEKFQPVLDFFSQFGVNVEEIDIGATIGNVVSDIIIKFQNLKDDLENLGLPTTLEDLATKLSDPIGTITGLFDKLAGKDSDGTTKNIFDFAKVLEDINGFFVSIGTHFSEWWSALWPVLEEAWKKLEPIVTPLITIFTNIFEIIAGLFNKIKEEGLTPDEIVNIGIFGAILYMSIQLHNLSENLEKIAKSFVESFNKITNGIADSIEAFSIKLQSEAFRNVAIGLAALIGAFVALSYLNTENLAAAVAGIELPLATVTTLMMVLAEHQDVLNSTAMLAVARMFRAFGFAALEIGSSIAIMAQFDQKSVAEAGVVLGLLMAEVKGFIDKLQKMSIDKTITAVTGSLETIGVLFIAIGTALLEMSVGVALIAAVHDTLSIAEAWGVVEAMIGTLIGAVYLLSKQQIKADPEVLLIIATSMIALAWAVDMIVGGLLALTLVDMGTVYQAFNIIVGISGIIGGIFELSLILMNYTAKETNPEALVNASVMLSAIGSAMIMIAIAIDIVVLGVIALASVPISEHQLSNALGMVGLITIIMGILTGVMAAISLSSEGVGAAVMLAVAGGMIMMAAAIDVVVAGIIALGIALKDFEQAGIGFDQFMGIFGAVMIFSAVMAIIGLMSAGVGGVGAMSLAVTLLIIAGAIALMAPALQKIGQMNDSEYIKGLILLAAVAIIFAVLAGMMLLAAPQALILSVAAISIGVSVVLLGAAFVELAFGLSAIAAAGTMALPVLVSVFAAISSGMMQGFVDGLEAFLKRVPELVPLIVDALWAIADGAFTMLINLLVWNVSSAVSGSVKVIIAFAKVASPLIGKLIEVLIDLLIDTLQGLNDGLEKNKHQLAYYIGNIIALLLEITIEALWVFLLKVIEWCSNAIPIIADQGAKAGVSLIDSFMEGIENMSKKITEFILKWRNKLLAIIPDAKDAAEKAGKMINGIAQGIGNATGTVWGAGEKLGNSIYNAAAGVLSINSPSKVFQDDFVGVGIIGGIVSGFDKYSGEAISSIESSTSSMFDAANSSLNKLDVTSMFDNFSPTITPVVDLTNVENSMNDISSMMPTTTYDFAQLTGYDFNYAKNLAEENKINESKHLDDLFAQLNEQEASLTDAILNANTDTKIYLDKDILVGSTYRDIDKRLGKQALLERRL